LESKGIDVFLGMDWLSKHTVLIDYSKKSVKLTTPDGKELEFVVEPVVTTKGVANHAKVRCKWLVNFPMSSLRSCQVCHLTVTSSL
jgi:hypothetical protein